MVVGLERLPGDDEPVALDHRAQVVLLEIGFLHQPVGEPAQQLRLRAAAFEPSRPEPHLIGEQLRYPPLADTVEDEERVAVVAAHHGGAVVDPRVDLAEPAPPAGLPVGRPCSRKPLGYRMPAAEIGQLRLEPFLEDVAGRLGRQDRAERGARQA